MKRANKSFAFWFLLVSVFGIFMHQIGQDSKSIVLIGLNSLLNMIADSDGFMFSLMESGMQVSCNFMAGKGNAGPVCFGMRFVLLDKW